MCDRILIDGYLHPMRFVHELESAGLRVVPLAYRFQPILEAHDCSCCFDLGKTATASGLLLERGDGVTCEWRMTSRHAGQSGLSSHPKRRTIQDEP
jgi:hypothetical protein